jgi:hypothetical protein
MGRARSVIPGGVTGVAHVISRGGRPGSGFRRVRGHFASTTRIRCRSSDRAPRITCTNVGSCRPWAALGPHGSCSLPAGSTCRAHESDSSRFLSHMKISESRFGAASALGFDNQVDHVCHRSIARGRRTPWAWRGSGRPTALGRTGGVPDRCRARVRRLARRR